MTSKSGPMWTRARLTRAMRLRFGEGPQGGVNTAAAADAMRVSRRSVQRWLHANHGRSAAHIPASRLAQLIALLLPSEETCRREAQQARYAAEAIARLGLPDGVGVKPAWATQRWTEPHTVVVIAVAHLGIRQIAVVRSERLKEAKISRRGRILDRVHVPTRFHATVVTHAVLQRVEPWRFQAGTDQVVQGYTQAWIDDAPKVRLADFTEHQDKVS